MFEKCRKKTIELKIKHIVKKNTAKLKSNVVFPKRPKLKGILIAIPVDTPTINPVTVPRALLMANQKMNKKSKKNNTPTETPVNMPIIPMAIFGKIWIGK